MKRLLLLTAFFVLTVNIKLVAQTFTVGNLHYSVNNDGVSVTVTGYVDDMEPLVIPDSVNYDGTDYPVTSIGNHAFQSYYYNVDEFVIPNSVTHIGDYAFSYSICGKHLILPDSLTYIGDYAFNHSNFQDELVIPNTVAHIGDWAFADSPRLSGNLYIPDSVTYLGEGAFRGCGQIRGSLYLPSSLDSIRDNTFDGCKFTGSLTIPVTVKSIGDYAFQSCNGFTGQLVVPQSVNHIGDSAFEGCANFEGKLVLPDSLTTIGNFTFSYCEGLSDTLKIPSAVTSIYDNAFSNCGFTGPLIIPDKVTYIGGAAFYQCDGFTGPLIIPDSVVEVGDWAFFKCTGLSGDLVIGKSVRSIGSFAFSYCSGITNVVSLATEPAEIYHDGFKYLDCTTLTVPCGYIPAYEQSGWHSHFTTINEDCNTFDPESPAWYYEIINPNGVITYQYLSHEGDTTLNHKKVKIIVKTNTLYDKEHVEQTKEYIYIENNVVYWWNKVLEEFTVLYDFGAQLGDYWEIKVGHTSLVMHVDKVGLTEYNGHIYKTLEVSDYDELYTGTIVCTVGHLTSFFPELPEDKGDYEVNSLRCYWNNDDLLYKEGDVDCDYIYHNYHFGVDENEAPAFTIYPNPATDAVTIDCDPVEMQFITSQIELMDIRGQMIDIRVKDNQIDVSNLQNGIYFIKIGNDIVKLIINR
ncbi:MAG: leucine-rich repeat domain-containing protein [Bacteroidales bacterium]|nr:leucine-rich repeat domain-containing protein [Bacteroidales bacterium]